MRSSVRHDRDQKSGEPQHSTQHSTLWLRQCHKHTHDTHPNNSHISPNPHETHMYIFTIRVYICLKSQSQSNPTASFRRTHHGDERANRDAIQPAISRAIQNVFIQITHISERGLGMQHVLIWCGVCVCVDAIRDQAATSITYRLASRGHRSSVSRANVECAATRMSNATGTTRDREPVLNTALPCADHIVRDRPESLVVVVIVLRRAYQAPLGFSPTSIHITQHILYAC